VEVSFWKRLWTCRVSDRLLMKEYISDALSQCVYVFSHVHNECRIYDQQLKCYVEIHYHDHN
jgi:hypothetical protein